MTDKQKKTKNLNYRVYGTVKVSSKGQVVIPAQIRKDYKIEEGDSLIFVECHPGVFSMIKAKNLEDIQDVLGGLAKWIRKHKKEAQNKHIEQTGKPLKHPF